MKKDNTGRFLYHAQGMGLGGFFTAPVDESIETQAAVSLPITGGYGRADSKDFRYRDFISIGEAHSYVSGKKKPEAKSETLVKSVAEDLNILKKPPVKFETLVTSVVEGLNILDVVTADRIVARLVSSHTGNAGENPTISTIGSHFVNLRIRGVLVDVNLFDAPEEGAAHETKSSPFVFTPMLGALPGPLEKYKLGPNSLYVPHFGSIYLGELIRSPETQRLTMLRVELGCSADGSLAFSTVEGDGHQV